MKRVKIRAGTPPSASDKTIRRILKKAGIKQRHVQKKGALTKNGLKLRLKFAQNVRQKLPNNF